MTPQELDDNLKSMLPKSVRGMNDSIRVDKMAEAYTVSKKTKTALLYQFLTMLIGTVGAVLLAKSGIPFWGAPLAASVFASIVMGFTAGSL